MIDLRCDKHANGAQCSGVSWLTCRHQSFQRSGCVCRTTVLVPTAAWKLVDNEPINSRNDCVVVSRYTGRNQRAH
jgi:hypothetical protein